MPMTAETKRCGLMDGRRRHGVASIDLLATTQWHVTDPHHFGSYVNIFYPAEFICFSRHFYKTRCHILILLSDNLRTVSVGIKKQFSRMLAAYALHLTWSTIAERRLGIIRCATYSEQWLQKRYESAIRRWRTEE